MRKILLLLVILTLFQHLTFSQNKHNIDSLQTQYRICTQDTQKVNILLALTREYPLADSMIVYGNKALTLSQKINFKLGIAKSYRRIGWGYNNKSDHIKALENFNNALKMDLEIGRNDRTEGEYINIGDCYHDQKNYSKALEYYNNALNMCMKMKDKKEMADSYRRIGVLFYHQSNRPKALEYINKSLKIVEELNEKDNVAGCLALIANIYGSQNNFTKALEYQLRGLKIAEESGDKESKVQSYYLVADVYNDIENYPKALEYAFKALKSLEEMGLGYKDQIEESYLAISGYYLKEKEYPKVMEYCQKALKMSESKDDIAVVCYEHIGEAYMGQNNYQQAMEYLLKSIKITEELAAKDSKMKPFLYHIYVHLGELYIKKKEYATAIKYLKMSIKSNIENQYELGSLVYGYSDIADAYEGLKDYKNAFEYNKKAKNLHDSIFSKENNKKLVDLQSNFDIEKKEIELNAKAQAEQEKIKAVAKAESKKQKLIIIFIALGLLFVMVFAGFVFRSLRIRNKQNKIIVEQKSIVEEKQKEILDSIEYALRIQTAILPPQKIVKQYLENSFILYKPKDIVAGDFYWMETVNDLVLFAACDCTGHGVPGAMVSVVCHNALNRAVREFGLTQPAAILDKTAEIVIENFSKSEEDIKDGMDISLCAYNAKTKTIQWAGANNPLWLLQNKELIETKADKQPIGMNENSKPFTNHTFKLNATDTIYLFTDGFADQFGGETGQKKLTKKRFKDLILSVQNKTMQEQGIALDKFITEYRKEVEQIDDILVMGVKV